MMSRTGHVVLAFAEPDLHTTAPQCVLFTACALAHGWRFVQDGGCNLMDCYVGPKHFRDFRSAPQSAVRRVIYFRHIGVQREVLAETFGLREFLARCQADAIFYRHVQQNALMPRKRQLLLEWFAAQSRHFLLEEPGAHDRQLIVPAFGGEVDLIAKLSGQYEGGW